MENTLILVTTDHGESLFDRGFLGHGGTLYGVEINGFLVAKTPASLGDVRPSPLIQFVDFFPTIADAIGVPAPSHIQGTPWGHGRDYAVSELFCRDCAYGTIERHKAFRRELVAVSIDNHKLIRSTLDPDEVYDLGVAGEELTLSAAPNPEFLQRAEEILGRRKADLVEVTGGPPADEETLQKMRSLGYVK
jgi:arylsulfatase A-like enzyme